MQDTMTVFYNKRLGKIKEVCDGSQSMSWFGDEAEDYAKIYDYIIVKYDQFVHNNFSNLEVVDGELKLVNQSISREYL